GVGGGGGVGSEACAAAERDIPNAPAAAVATRMLRRVKDAESARMDCSQDLPRATLRRLPAMRHQTLGRRGSYQGMSGTSFAAAPAPRGFRRGRHSPRRAPALSPLIG